MKAGWLAASWKMADFFCRERLMVAQIGLNSRQPCLIFPATISVQIFIHQNPSERRYLLSREGFTPRWMEGRTGNKILRSATSLNKLLWPRSAFYKIRIFGHSVQPTAKRECGP